MAWSKRDLQIFCEGMAVGGKYNLSSVAGYKPEAWNDPGVYNYFYMNFQKVMANFSPAQFMECVMVQGNAGWLTITNVEKVSPMVVRVYCNLEGQTSGVNVYGKASSWLMFANGRPVPSFATTFTVAGLSTTITLAYVYDTVSVHKPFTQAQEGATSCIYYSTQKSSAYDEVTVPLLSAVATDDALITYS